MHVLEFFVDDGDEHVQEDEESSQLERHPVEVGDATSVDHAVVHDHVPTLTSGRSDQDADTQIECPEVQVLVVDHLTFLNVAKELHSSHGVGENDQHE